MTPDGGDDHNAAGTPGNASGVRQGTRNDHGECWER